MTTPAPTTPLSAQLIELEQQAARLEHHEATIATLDSEILELQTKRDDAMRALTVSLSARDRLGSIGAIIAPLLTIRADVHVMPSAVTSAAEPPVEVAAAPVTDHQQDAPVEGLPDDDQPEVHLPDTSSAVLPQRDVTFPADLALTAQNRILIHLWDEGAATAAALSATLDINPSTTASRLSKMTSEGITSRSSDVPALYSITGSGMTLLRTLSGNQTPSADAPNAAAEPEPEPASAASEPVTPEIDQVTELPKEPEAAAPAVHDPEPELDPTPEPAVQQDVPVAEPDPQEEPSGPTRPDGLDGRVLAYLEDKGPATIPPIAAFLNFSGGPIGAALYRLHQSGLIERLTDTQPFLWRMPGDTREQVPWPPVRKEVTAKKPEAPRQHGSGEIMPTELLKQRAKNCKAVKKALAAHKKPMTENDLLKATGLVISHLRTAVQMLTADNVVVREDGSGFGVRATYRLEDIKADIPEPNADHLTDLGRKVERILLDITDRGGKESIPNLAVLACMAREDVVEALGVLHYHQSRLRWIRVGSLLLFQAVPAADEVAA